MAMNIGDTVLVEGKEVIVKKIYIDEDNNFMIGYDLNNEIELRYFDEVTEL
jgi:hypothetical protein